MGMGEDKTVTTDCGRKQRGQLFVRSGEGQMGKGPSSQSYGFSSSHIWMWELTIKKAER